VKTASEPKKKKKQTHKNPKYFAMKLSQIRRRIELCMREIILRFEMNLYKFTFFLDRIIHIRIFKVSTEVRIYGAVETLGDLQSISRGLDPGDKM
jgi:hypothetical protein